MIGNPSVVLTAESKAKALTGMWPWSWYMQTKTSVAARLRGRNAVSGGNGNVLHWQSRFVNESFCEMQALRVRNRLRRCADVLVEQAPQMPAGDTQSICELFDVAVVQRTA